MADNTVENKEDAENKKQNLDDKSNDETALNLRKKYLVLLQKAKNKSDGLAKKCSVLEEEKNAAIQEHQSTEKELLSEISILRQKVSELAAEKDGFAKKDQEIIELKNKLKEADVQAASFRENEEQLQCLNSQLQSLKDSCRCLQEENNKVTKLNKDLSDEITSLNNAKNAISLDLKKKLEECNLGLNEKEEIKVKHETCIEKNNNLQFNFEKLSFENTNLQKDNLILINSLQELKNHVQLQEEKISDLTKESESFCKKISTLTNENEILCKENCSYLQQVEDLKATEPPSCHESNFNILVRDIETYRKKNESLLRENEKLKEQVKLQNENTQHKITVTDSKKIYAENITRQYSKPVEQGKISKPCNCSALGEKCMKLQSELDKCLDEKQKLEEKIKIHVSVSEFSKAGFELALLQGASTEALIHSSDLHNPDIRNTQPKSPYIDDEVPSDARSDSIYSHESTLGLEYALIQGGNVLSLNESGPISPENIYVNQVSVSHSELYSRNSDISPPEDSSGLEYALLQGGDVTCLTLTSNESEPMSPIDVFANQASSTNGEKGIEKLQAEIESLRLKLKEYSDLCSDTLQENESLKNELETLKSESIAHHGLSIEECERVKKKHIGECESTGSQLQEKYVILCSKIVNLYGKVHLKVNDQSLVPLKDEPLKLLEIIEDLVDLQNKESEVLEESKEVKEKEIDSRECNDQSSELNENYTHLYKEIVELYRKIHLKKNESLEHLKDDPVKLIGIIENDYLNLVDNFQRKCSEINDFNLQLELLVIGIKQGVRQKNSTTSYQAENKFEENMSLLKVLLEDLVMRSNNYASKIRILESSSISENKKIKEELNQIKELNQFLEVENRELNNEVKKLKCCLIDAENDNGECRENYQRSPELYSIDESNELEENIDTNANLTADDSCHLKSVNTCELCPVQVDPDFKDVSNIHNHARNENELVIEMLTKENESLKVTIEEKSILVEKINCVLDSRLTEIEELRVELQEKEDDLKHSKCLNADLKKIQMQVENIKQQQINALEVAQTSVHELKIENDDLNENIKSFGLSFKEFITHVNDNIMNIIKQSSTNLDHFMGKCNHKEQNLSKIKDWICDLTNDFKAYLDVLDHINKETSSASFDVADLPNRLQVSPQDFSLSNVYDQEVCCLISDNIKTLNSLKFKFLSEFYTHLNSNYMSLIKDVDNYKVNIIPKMEINISELENKLSEYIYLNNSKTVINNVQKEDCEEPLKKQLADTETKMLKFKQIALKLKKELAQTKEQCNEVTLDKEKLLKENAKLLDEFNKISDDQCKYVQNYQSLQNEFDKLQDDWEMHKSNIKVLEEGLSAKLLEVTACKEKITELEAQLNISKQSLESNLFVKKELEVRCTDLESKVIILESKISEKVQKINLLEEESSKQLIDLTAALDENRSLRHQLEFAQKEGTKKSLLDLEMEDYERSITDLNNQIQKKDDEVADLQSDLKCMKEKFESLQEELRSTETLKETEARRAASLKEILDKTKEELDQAKEHEAELQSKTASLEVHLENLTQQEESNKLQLTESLVQIQHLQDVLKTSSDNHQRIARSFEQKIANQKQEILVAHKEVESVKQEFENYKIRVHSVLKQQKTVMPAITTVDADLKEKLETMNEKLRLQVKDLREKLTAMSLEYDTLQEEHDSLLQRYNKAIDDREEKDKEWHQRLELVNAEKIRLRATQEELSSQHLLQNEMLVATYKKQIKIMSEEHKRIVSDLQKQLDAADVEIARLQRDQQRQQGLPLTPLPQDNSAFDILSQERQEGEGSESTDDTNTPVRQLSLATIPTSGFLPFEKLLQLPIEPGTPASYISSYDSEKLSVDLSTANKKIDHLSELLNDSESTNLRMSEQVRVLKEEVRRLENNKEREQHAENLEYLKNVFIKFASLQPGSEKSMLIPVLTTMLKLSPNEQQQLKLVAGDIDGGDSSNAGWSSYLHRWSGLS